MTNHEGIARPVSAVTVTLLGFGCLFHLRGVEATSFLITMLIRVVADLHGFAMISFILWVVLTCCFLVLGGLGSIGSSMIDTCDCRAPVPRRFYITSCHFFSGS